MTEKERLKIVAKNSPVWEPMAHQPHYERFKIQPIKFIMENGLGYCEGNVVKYICRYQYKNGAEDLIKAKVYLDFLIDDLKQREAK